eukprot:CAMPEP_0204278260 /NCGR_PEP_ID=MMETSP0468-20130131/29766_1 /ASSEMBLY_ACC=CAM_ASM_000383 /TAXON_ID=2969 /ORGANISM="Oxyrrhis marina" /LENGTH=91 /DNA_ID=CAMNT_0051255143 /DNA_START=168 /DNA_END=443 /DNA_ORIENTATION=+
MKISLVAEREQRLERRRILDQSGETDSEAYAQNAARLEYLDHIIANSTAVRTQYKLGTRTVAETSDYFGAIMGQTPRSEWNRAALAQQAVG